MIRIILQEIDGKFHLDVLNTATGGRLDLQHHADFVNASAAVSHALADWRHASKQKDASHE